MQLLHEGGGVGRVRSGSTSSRTSPRYGGQARKDRGRGEYSRTLSGYRRSSHIHIGCREGRDTQRLLGRLGRACRVRRKDIRAPQECGGCTQAQLLLTVAKCAGLMAAADMSSEVGCARGHAAPREEYDSFLSSCPGRGCASCPDSPPHLAPRGSRRDDVSQQLWGACERLEDLRAGVTRCSRRLARQSCPEWEAGSSRESQGRARGQGTSARRATHDRYLAICGDSLGLDTVSFWNSRWIVRRGVGSAPSMSHGAEPFERLRSSSARIDGRLQPLWAILCEFYHYCCLLHCVCCCSHWLAVINGHVRVAQSTVPC